VRLVGGISLSIYDIIIVCVAEANASLFSFVVTDPCKIHIFYFTEVGVRVYHIIQHKSFKAGVNRLNYMSMYLGFGFSSVNGI
jgi:hypothetical protein